MPIAVQGIDVVLNNVARKYKVRERSVRAIALFWGATILSQFQKEQLSQKEGKYWTNRTYDAAEGVYYKTALEAGIVFVILAHSMKYGEYLELANNRKHAALYPLMKRYAGRILSDVKEIYKG